MELPDVQRLAEELIELRCGTHSVANVYEFLSKAYGDRRRAKADFIRFLSGDLPARVLRAASEWISEEQGQSWQPQIIGDACPVMPMEPSRDWVSGEASQAASVGA